jgi:hypothetical protein
MTPTTDELLAAHRPIVRYDSQEPYFADAAQTWTDQPSNVLLDAHDQVIAAATPAAGGEQLSLALLGNHRYANGTATSAADRINNTTSPHNYVAQAQAMHAKAGYANRMYGHAATDRFGNVWLAYWFFYFYNDYNLVGDLLKAGLHEGDWEMIQLRLGPDRQTPDLAVYAQHTHAATRPWAAVERVGERPVVYSARGSHASYFNADVHWTGDWFDHADGKRPAPELELEIVRDGDPNYHWVAWPGRWGGTKQPSPGIHNPLNDGSPNSPGSHGQWTDPAKLLDKAESHAPAPPTRPPLPAPTVNATHDGAQLQVSYATTIARPAALIVTTSAAGDHAPPTLHRFPIADASGAVTIPAAAAGEGAQIVHVSVADADGHASGVAASTPAAQRRI